MRITFDPAKRDHTLAERGLDVADAEQVFAGQTIEGEDLRYDYGETRIITAGHLFDRTVVVVWTERGGARHIISMRKANAREQARYAERLGRS